MGIGKICEKGGEVNKKWGDGFGMRRLMVLRLLFSFFILFVIFIFPILYFSLEKKL